MSKPNLCTVVENRFVEPCQALELASTKDLKRKTKGILRVELTYISGENFGKPSRSYFLINSGHFTGKGIVMNFCPFCGVRIDSPVLLKK